MDELREPLNLPKIARLRLTAIALVFSLLFVQMPPVFAASWKGNLTQQGQVAFSRENLQSTLTQANNITKQLYQQGTEVFDDLDLMGLVIGGGAAYTTINNSLSGVPQDFYALLKEMPKVAKRVKSGAGLREGGRSAEDAYKLFQKIPGAALIEANERKVRVFLSNKDGSHIISDKNSGSSSSSNIFWELGGINKARGSLNTTQLELIASRLYNGAEAIVQNSGTVAKLGLQATSIAVLVDALVEAEIHAIKLANGEITVDEFLILIQDAVGRTAISAAAFYTLTVIAISIFPELVPILSTPALVTASQIILGSRLALPLLRLIPAL